MAERSSRILLYDNEKENLINKETIALYRKYQMDMSVRDLSPTTVSGYNSDLMQWFIYIYDNQGNISVKDITDDDLEEYYYFRKKSGNNANRQKRVMASISAFYKFLRKKKLITESPMEFIERPKNAQTIVTQTFLTKEQVQLMREKLLEHGDIQLTTYAFLSLSTMARVNAIANLRWNQIDMENRVCSNVLEKEGKIVELYFSEEVKGYLKELIRFRKENNIDDNGWVFTTPYTDKNKPIENSTLSKWCKVIGEMIGVPTLHCHDFRHSGATLLKNGGMSLEAVSGLLNHSGTDVTKKFYIREDTTKLRNLKDSIEF